jgi:hypothetical protein
MQHWSCNTLQERCDSSESDPKKEIPIDIPPGCVFDKVMDIKLVAYTSINRVLSAFGMCLNPIVLDFKKYPLNETIQNALFREFAVCADEWLRRQDCFQPVSFDVEATVREFFFSYLESPFRVPVGGSRFNNLLWLSLLARAFDPAVIIESGTFKGGSSWALKFGAPNAEVWSFDIVHSQIKLRTPGVQYRKQDWSTFDFGERLGKRALAYFDDHMDQARRLLEAHERNIPLAIFDDDCPVVPALLRARRGMTFPKIEFVLNEELRREKEIVWKSGSRTLRWSVDAGYLDRARQVIAVTERLPDTSLMTGIHQAPYRVVKIKPHS